MKSSRPRRTSPLPATRRRMMRGVRVGSSGIQGSSTPQEGHIVASVPTGIAQSRQETMTSRAFLKSSLNSGLEERKRDQADDTRRGHEDRFRNLEPPEHAETDERHGSRRHVVDRAPGQEDDGTGDGAGGR